MKDLNRKVKIGYRAIGKPYRPAVLTDKWLCENIETCDVYQILTNVHNNVFSEWAFAKHAFDIYINIYKHIKIKNIYVNSLVQGMYLFS